MTMPARVIRLDASLEARFWRQVDKSGECWLWTGRQKRKGYGVMCAALENTGTWVDGFVHRVSWLIHFGQPPVGMLVLHHCDVPACVRPEHLFLGTWHDNNIDCADKRRDPNSRKTLCRNGHPYSTHSRVKLKPKTGRLWRICRLCDRIRKQRTRRAARAAAAEGQS